jgi:hypothetical protein
MDGLDTTHAGNVGSEKEKKHGNYNTNNVAQCDRLLEWLRCDSLTTLQAREHLDIMHPAARIMELRRQKHNILTYWTTDDNGKGKHRVARYVLLSGAAND